jgi:hypothetical protein
MSKQEYIADFERRTEELHKDYELSSSKGEFHIKTDFG